MKKIIYLAVLVVLSSCSQNTNEAQAEVQTIEGDHIEIYDFHTTHRCETCLAIEKATKEVLNENFKSELDAKKITFTLLNADSEENQAIVEEYLAYGTTLAITIFKDDKKEIIDITNWAFDAIHGDSFKSELIKKLNDALKKL